MSFLNRHRALFVLVLFSAALLLPNLGNVYLWQDEAETALLARNVLVYCYPRAFDGRNVITQNHELEFNESWVWTWSPWLQFYVTAGAFLVLGEGTLSARLPFAMFGIASIVLLYFYALELVANRRVALLSGWVAATSIPFLLHARQCRWYMVAVFAAIWLLYAYLRMQRGRKIDTIQFAAAACMLFYSNYVVLAYILGGICLHFLGVSFRGGLRPPLRSMVSGLTAVALLAAPWAIYARIWSRPNPLGEYPIPWLGRTAHVFWESVVSLNGFSCP